MSENAGVEPSGSVNVAQTRGARGRPSDIDISFVSKTPDGPKLETPVGDAPVIPLFLIFFGAYLMWFGVKYWRGTGPAVWPSYPIKSVLQGKGLPAPEPAPPISAELSAYETAAAGNITAPGSAPPGGTVGGSGIATDALRYQGAPYKWGGANPQGWDCSGFVNWVIGHDLHFAIPGSTPQSGGFDGSSHGPVVAQWITTPLCQSVSTPQPGDLACWPPNAHMGVVINPTEMISALNPALGTRVTSIASAHTGVPVYRRLKQAGTGGPGGGGGGSAQNTAKLLFGRFGWDPQVQFPPLLSLWTRESNWSPIARNPTSGALGIAQALGHGTTETGGTLGNEYGAQYGLTVDDARAANSGNALQQIRWGLGYIKARYSTPSAAWAHEQAAGWY